MIQDPSSSAHEISLLATALHPGASTAAFRQWSPIAFYAFQFYVAAELLDMMLSTWLLSA